METERALDLMVVLVYYSMENKLDPAQVGLVRMCAFILQTLSSDRTFGVKLNRPFDGHSSLPAAVRIPAFHGTYADFLIIVSETKEKENKHTIYISNQYELIVSKYIYLYSLYLH